MLYEIEHISYKMGTNQGKSEKRKKRVTTENAMEQHSNHVPFIKSNSNSRLPSGRKHITPFN